MNQDTSHTNPSRRHFLAQSVHALAAATCLNAISSPLGTNNPLSAADAITRNGKPHMKLSLAAYSFNSLMPRRNTSKEKQAAAKFSLEKFIDFCAEQNLDATELTAYYFPDEITNDYLNSLKERSFRLGLDISGTAIGNDFCLREGEARQASLKMCREWIDYSATLGAPVIRIFAGNVPAGDTEDAARERCIDAINQSLEYAAKKGVCLALENHHGITDTADQMLKIIKGVKPSPWFGVNFDGGNFTTADPYADLAKIAPYATNAQVKIDVQPNGKKEPADMARVIKLLKDVHYRGYIVLEYEGEEDPFVAIPKHMKKLRELIS